MNKVDQCPSNDFEQGNANGRCWGDGHYRCKVCKHYRADFKRNGQEYIDFVHVMNKQVEISIL